MSPGFHPNFPFETLLQWTWSNHHQSCQSLSFWRNFFIVIQTLILSTTFVQFQTSTSSPKFSKKLLPLAFNLTCLLTHCLICLLLFDRSTYRNFHSAETTLLEIHNDLILAMDRGEVTSLILLDRLIFCLWYVLLIIPSFLRLQHWFGLDDRFLDWFSSSYLSFRSQAVSINDFMIFISAFSTLSCGVPQGSVLGPPFSLSIQLLLARWSQKIPSNIICSLRWWHPCSPSYFVLAYSVFACSIFAYSIFAYSVFAHLFSILS